MYFKIINILTDETYEVSNKGESGSRNVLEFAALLFGYNSPMQGNQFEFLAAQQHPLFVIEYDSEGTPALPSGAIV